MGENFEQQDPGIEGRAWGIWDLEYTHTHTHTCMCATLLFFKFIVEIVVDFIFIVKDSNNAKLYRKKKKACTGDSDSQPKLKDHGLF